MESPVVSDCADMLGAMAPELHPEPYRFVLQNRADGVIARFDKVFAVIRENEGTTLIVKSAQANESGQSGPDFARITLNVHSDLHGVGLTAAVSKALASEDIACNVIAGFHHDHLFVPWDARETGLALLEQLSQDARR